MNSFVCNARAAGVASRVEYCRLQAVKWLAWIVIDALVYDVLSDLRKFRKQETLLEKHAYY